MMNIHSTSYKNNETELDVVQALSIKIQDMLKKESVSSAIDINMQHCLYIS